MSYEIDTNLMSLLSGIENGRLSSKDTFLHKIIITPIWVIVYWPVVIFSIGGFKEWRLYLPFTILWLILLVYMKAKEVSLVGGKLVVSNFVKKIRIDISEIESVGGSIFLYPEFIWLNLKNNSEFGRKIIFITKPRETFFSSLTFWRRHPLVEKLRYFCQTCDEGI